jgi:hypothetical protein
MSILQQRVDFVLIVQRKPKTHRQHTDSTMNGIEDSGMKHRRDGLMRCVDEGAGQLARKAPTHINGTGSLFGHIWYVSAAADA